MPGSGHPWLFSPPARFVEKAGRITGSEPGSDPGTRSSPPGSRSRPSPPGEGAQPRQEALASWRPRKDRAAAAVFFRNRRRRTGDHVHVRRIAESGDRHGPRAVVTHAPRTPSCSTPRPRSSSGPGHPIPRSRPTGAAHTSPPQKGFPFRIPAPRGPPAPMPRPVRDRMVSEPQSNVSGFAQKGPVGYNRAKARGDEQEDA